MFKFLKEKILIENPYKQEFNKMNTEYNNIAASFMAVIYLLVTGFAITVAYIGHTKGAADVKEFEIILPIYIVGFILSIISVSVLLYLRKKGMSGTWQSEFFAILQICLCIILMLISAHVEIPAIGIKNINAIILVMFATLFFFRFKLSVIMGIEIATVVTTVIMLFLERSGISNFTPSFVNIIVAGILACMSAYLYWRSRVENYIMSKDLKKLVTSDSLTKVFNRRGFDSFFLSAWGAAVKEHSQMSMFIIDIDYFKRYNDFYGHIKGDECLTTVANVLSKSIRKTDFVARYGGEEFAVIMVGTDYKEAKTIAERIFANIQISSIPHRESLVSPIVTVSIGCMVCFPATDGISQQEFLALADEALYMAKERGRNRLVFHPGIRQQSK